MTLTQLIYCDLKLKDFGFYLKVVKGSPVTPIKPTRSKLIEDQKLTELRLVIVDALFETLNRSDQTQVSVDVLYNLSRIDGDRFIRENPFFLSNAVLPYESGTKQTNLEVQMQAHLYTNQPVLVDSEVTLIGCENRYEEVTQMATFSRGCGVTFHELVIGNANKLLQQTLYWKAGQPHEVANHRVKETWFYERGEWGLGTNDQPPTVWNPVTRDVMLYDNSDGSYPSDIHWMIGCDDPIDCFRSDAWITFANEDSDNPDAYERGYDRSIDSVVRSLMGNAISSRFSQNDLEWFAREQTGRKDIRVQKVEWQNQEGKPTHKITISGTANQSTEEGSTGTFEIEAKLYD